MQIRRLTHDDPSELLRAAGLLVQRSYVELPGYPVDPPYDAVVADVPGRVDETVVIAGFLDGALIACATFVAEHGPHNDFEDPEATTIRYFGVDAAARGSGAGEQMVRWCIAATRELGKRRIRIHTITQMERAIRLYERLGFERTPALDATVEEPPIQLLAYVLELVPAAP